ncbi:MAG: hypothetical protein F2667_09835 [Actinobacteria bacterium]|uniref:Unannotated protein n=1 Tax=freshwater metagenome TaxID=449393 RepID=A0A6J6RJ35_9ZZZZ|nr:hypothetical protein [Actinomycetota bacterium]
MSVRTPLHRRLSGLVAVAVASSALALVAAPAHAATDADDTTFTPVAADLIGVGSDTSQNALKRLAEGYNATNPTVKVATFAATGGGTIALPTAAINRPNGSGAGKALLYGSANNTDVDFARSSSAQSAAETQAGLQSFPFALDTLVLAVSGTVASNAPTTITPAQMVSIYKGDVTNWSQIGGKDGVIAPKIPQAGSGTRSFFVAQLKAANGGVDVTLAKSVAEVQEHDDTAIKNDANAVAPFSEGRAGLLGATLRLETGFRADRALYNVVRGTDIALPAVQAVFGESGFVCSTAARPLIEAAGFKQLATSARGGVCGSQTQSATTNFTLNQAVVTTTALSVTSTAANSATLTAVVSGSTAPSGTVTFKEGTTVLAANVPLTSGQAVYTASGATAGAHTYTAQFVPAQGSQFEGSSDEATGSVKTSSSIDAAFPKSVKKGKAASGTITVAAAGSSTSPTGTVTITQGSTTVATKTLVNGAVKVKLPKLTKKKTTFTITYSGDDAAVGSTTKVTIKTTK